MILAQTIILRAFELGPKPGPALAMTISLQVIAPKLPLNRYKLESLSNGALLQLLYQCYDLRVFTINSVIFMLNKTGRNERVNIKM